jgi:polar amino acid transport system substrate-binding protein
VALAILSTAGPSVAVPSNGPAVSRIVSRGVLRWGGDIQGGEPYAYEDPKAPGHLTGFEVDLADAIAKELGVRAEFVQNDWSNLIPSLERGTFDVIMNGLEVTEGRRGRLLFSRPYYVFAETLMARATDGSMQPTLAALSGKRVGTLAQSLAYEMLQPVAEPVLYEGVDEPYQDLVSGRVDAVLLDDIIAARYGMPKQELRVVGELGQGTYALGIRLDEPDVKEAVDGAIGKLEASGELRRILDRYGLWNGRQAALGTFDGVKDKAAASTPSMPPAFTGHHVLQMIGAAAVTLLVSSLAMVLAVVLGLGLSLLRMFGGGVPSRLAGAYVEIYRGTPVLLQLYLLYYGLAPVLRMNPIVAAIVGLGMNYAAYEAEVYRAGLQAVPREQMESALALGMSQAMALRRVVLPQALRFAIPNVTNDFIALLKDSSLVSVITVVELTKRMTIVAVDVRSWLLPGGVCAILYFAMSYPLGRLARRLEKKLEGEREAT